MADGNDSDKTEDLTPSASEGDPNEPNDAPFGRFNTSGNNADYEMAPSDSESRGNSAPDEEYYIFSYST